MPASRPCYVACPVLRLLGLYRHPPKRKGVVAAGGSCRIPASVTGVLGFRPTTGCWPAADGIVPMSTTRDTVGAPRKP